jgi:hypothetical protein
MRSMMANHQGDPSGMKAALKPCRMMSIDCDDVDENRRGWRF